MNDLISRSALLEAYDKAHKGPPGGARKLIEEAPEAIVRCEHCWKRAFDNCPFNEYSLVVPKDDFFCGAGEREMKNEE